MSNAFLLLTSYVVNAVWQLPLLGAVGWGLSRWVRRTGPELQHKIWVAVFILATLVPATPILQSYFAHEGATGELSASSPSVLAPLGGHQVLLTGSHIVLPPTVIYLVSGLYIVALVFLSLRLCWVIHCTSALVRNAEPASIEPDYLAMWNRSKEMFFVQTASLLRSGDIPGPVAAGFRRPVLLLPATFIEEHSRTEFLAAIGHECAHIERNDFWKNMFYEVVGLLTAFHPVTWFIKSQIAQTREMVCDRMAADRLLDRRVYGQSLLHFATKMTPAASSGVLHTMGMFDTNTLERRIMTLMTSLPRVSRIRRYLLGVTVVLVLSICAGVSGSFTQSVAAQTSKPSTQTDSAGAKQENSKDLSCTYYDDKTIGSPGTCGFDKQDKTKYRCFSNADPRKSQTQIGCEWKVLRAAAAKK